jgi:hypothetical protein
MLGRDVPIASEIAVTIPAQTPSTPNPTHPPPTRWFQFQDLAASTGGTAKACGTVEGVWLAQKADATSPPVTNAATNPATGDDKQEL